MAVLNSHTHVRFSPMAVSPLYILNSHTHVRFSPMAVSPLYILNSHIHVRFSPMAVSPLYVPTISAQLFRSWLFNYVVSRDCMHLLYNCFDHANCTRRRLQNLTHLYCNFVKVVIFSQLLSVYSANKLPVLRSTGFLYLVHHPVF
jgi:hypothetical protein